MKCKSPSFSQILLALPLILAVPVVAQPSSSLVQNFVAADPGGGGSASQTMRPSLPVASASAPFSRFAFGGGISPLGINMMAATNVNRYVNLRGTGNVFKFTDNGISTNGFNVDAKLNLASAGVAADVFPFPNHGFRVSPGLLFYNNNGATATFSVQGGTSFTLNDYTYYASSTNPVMGNGSLGLNTRKPAFTLTTGWGNMLPHNGGHWSFPVEVGVAFVGAPSLNIALTSGQVCDAQGLNCVNVATDPSVQANLQAQITKYKSDLDPLKTYPIISGGVAYSFHLRRY
ncbi:MAG TPA: hypothetical protein VFB43_12750 [Terracidiphilus sp.]|nr:hypothetical protein [Terracidiphilus sp.]